MSLPVPKPGLVIRYSFLWSSEHGEGATEGACVTGLFFSVRFAPDINVCHAWPHGGCRAKLN
jgi:hypothetical protein